MGEYADYINGETGAEFALAYGRYKARRRPRGPGPCPRCGGLTQITRGERGVFYGCTQFPKCHGSRDGVPLNIPEAPLDI